MPFSEKSGFEDIQVGRVLTTEVVLTSLEVKALRATPKLLVSGRPGQVVQFLGATLKLNYAGTNGFTETADNLVVRYTNTTAATVSSAIETTGFIDQVADTVTAATPRNDAIVAHSVAKGASLVLHNTGDGEIIGNAANNNTLVVTVSYVMHDLG